MWPHLVWLKLPYINEALQFWGDELFCYFMSSIARSCKSWRSLWAHHGCGWWLILTWIFREGRNWFNEPDTAAWTWASGVRHPPRSRGLKFITVFSRPSQATDVAAEVKRKLDKKEKKRKKREKKQQELEANGGTNGDAEVKSAHSLLVWLHVWFEVGPASRGPVSVYDMPELHDSEPLAGPTQWTWPLKWVRQVNH